MPTFTAQEWVNTNLTDKGIKKLLLSPADKEKVLIKEMIGIGGQLTGDLTLENYLELEEVEIDSHTLTSLTVINCPKLKSLDVRENELTKLELLKVNGDNNNSIKEIIASDNKLTTLDLTKCQGVKELLISDNPNLKELINLNHNILDNFNKVNTQIDLSSGEKQLIKKNEALFGIVKGVNDMGKQHELVLVEPIFSPEQNTEAIKRLLMRTRDDWTAYFEDVEKGLTREQLAKKYPMLHLSFQFPKLRDKAEKVLIVISGVIEKNYQYKELLKEWNGEDNEQKPYNPIYDFDLALFAFLNHLRAIEPLRVLWENQPLPNPVFYDF